MRAMVSRAPVTVVTLFSAAGPPPHTRAARKFLRQCGADRRLLRCSTDVAARTWKCSTAWVSGMCISGTRTRCSVADVTRRGCSSGRPGAARARPPLSDVPLRHRPRPGLPGRPRAARPRHQRGGGHARGAAVFAPLGVGRHVDHLLARKVGEHLGAVLYADFPYTARDPEGEAVAAGGLRPWAWTDDLPAKRSAIAGYRRRWTRFSRTGDPAAAGDVLRAAPLTAPETGPG